MLDHSVTTLTHILYLWRYLTIVSLTTGLMSTYIKQIDLNTPPTTSLVTTVVPYFDHCVNYSDHYFFESPGLAIKVYGSFSRNKVNSMWTEKF